MRRMSVIVLSGFVAGAAWISAQSDEPRGATKPAAAGSAKSGGAADKRAADGEAPPDGAPASEDAAKEVVSGKVLPLVAALKERGIKSYAEELKGQVVLVTEEGELIPIVPDWRGRAFYQDERLRDRPVDLVVNRHKGVPWVQVLSIYTFDERGVRNITDYWCDVCAIPMYEIKDCECCQGPTRLRFRPQDLPKDVARRASQSRPKNQATSGETPNSELRTPNSK